MEFNQANYLKTNYKKRTNVDKKLGQAFKYNRNHVNVLDRSPKAPKQETMASRKKLVDEHENIKLANKTL